MKYKQKGTEIGALVEQKNQAYGDSFTKSGEILHILYPKGIEIEQYPDMLTMVRIIDKLFRIATNKDVFRDAPWIDIAGYAILKAAQEENENEKL